MKKTIIVILSLVIVSIAYYLISPLWRVIELDEKVPSVSETQSEESQAKVPELKVQSAFVAKAHEVQGRAMIYEQDGSSTLRFENFETVNGPNLHIYLAADQKAQDFIDLGPIKATKGNVNYNLPASIDLEKYNQVIVFCVPFKVVFSLADLSM